MRHTIAIIGGDLRTVKLTEMLADGENETIEHMHQIKE